VIADSTRAHERFFGFTHSICAGMPQQTRLEVPAMATKLLSQPELVTVLAAVLSAPPVDTLEAPLSRLSPIDGAEL
jgi:hypothetical protein